MTIEHDYLLINDHSRNDADTRTQSTPPVRADRVRTQTDIGKDHKRYKYGVDTDLSIFDPYAARINRITGEAEYDGLADTDGMSIDPMKSDLSQQEQWLAKKYTPKPVIIKKYDENAPSLDELVTIGRGQIAKKIIGTPDSPNINHKVLPNNLFIDGKASQDDIRQAKLRDCYFLAALLQVIHYDPKFLPSIMTMHGDEVYAELCHREGNETSGYRWVRKPIAVKWGVTLRGEVDKHGHGELSHYGSLFRVNHEPEKTVKWSAEFDHDTLKFNRTEYYQAAMWVQCLERAFADYSKLYGKDGTGKTDGDRYENISGGAGWTTLHMLYGDRIASESHLKDHVVEPESNASDMIESASGMLESMARLAQMQDGSKDTLMHITTWAYYKEIIPRIKFYTSRIKTLVEQNIRLNNYKTYNTLLKGALKDLNMILVLVQEFSGLTTEEGGTEEKKTEQQKKVAYSLHEHERALDTNEGFMALKLNEYVSLKASLGSLISPINSDTKQSKDPKDPSTPNIYDNLYIYTNHEYNIREVHFIHKSGKEIDVNTLYSYYVNDVPISNVDPDKVDTRNGQLRLDFNKLRSTVDVDKSYVVIQNPHATGKAIYPGQKEARKATGSWTTSFRELFAGTTGYTAVIIKGKTHSQTGTEDVMTLEGVGGAINFTNGTYHRQCRR